MVKLYVKKIKAGQMTLEDVPTMWRAKVAAELAKEEDNSPA